MTTIAHADFNPVDKDGPAWDSDELIAALGRSQQTASSEDALLSTLNPRQTAAALAKDGPVLLIAGAGTGKTKTLVTRIAYLIKTGQADPARILVLTFTNDAAGELKTRLHGLIGDAAEPVWIGTFHSISMRMLRDHPAEAGLQDSNFKPIPKEDQHHAISEAMRDEGMAADPGRDGMAAWWRRVAFVHQKVTELKEAGLDPDQAFAQADPDVEDGDIIPRIYRRYQARLGARNEIDFADMVLHMVRLLRASATVLATWQAKFDYIHIDEYQDTNDLQEEFVTYLAGVRKNLWTVGDPRQSVYQWRRAKPELIINFPKRWPGARVYELDQNYRSTVEILYHANAIFDGQALGRFARLVSDRHGLPPQFTAYQNAAEEADGIADDIAAHLALGKRLSDIALLFRMRDLMVPFERALTARGLPHKTYGGENFVEQEEVRDAIAYMRMAIDPTDIPAFLRIVDRPDRDIGDDVALQIADDVTRGRSANLIDACRRLGQKATRFMTSTRFALSDLAETLEAITQVEATAENPGDAIRKIMAFVGYKAWRVKEGDQFIQKRMDSIGALAAMADRHPTTAGWLTEISLALLEPDLVGHDDKEVIRLYTLHGAKGLEFPIVYMPAMEETILPNARSVAEHGWGLAEERQLAHVGMTRAKDRLYTSMARFRHRLQVPSRFLFSTGILKEAEAERLALATRVSGNKPRVVRVGGLALRPALLRPKL